MKKKKRQYFYQYKETHKYENNEYQQKYININEKQKVNYQTEIVLNTGSLFDVNVWIYS